MGCYLAEFPPQIHFGVNAVLSIQALFHPRQHDLPINLMNSVKTPINKRNKFTDSDQVINRDFNIFSNSELLDSEQDFVLDNQIFHPS